MQLALGLLYYQIILVTSRQHYIRRLGSALSRLLLDGVVFTRSRPFLLYRGNSKIMTVSRTEYVDRLPSTSTSFLPIDLSKQLDSVTHNDKVLSVPIFALAPLSQLATKCRSAFLR